MTLQTGTLVIGAVVAAVTGFTVGQWPKAPKAYNTYSVLVTTPAGDTALTVGQWPKAPKAYGTFSTIGAYAPPINHYWG